MRQVRVGFLLMLFVTTAPDTLWAQATTTVQTMTVPFVDNRVNPCNGETFTVAGELTITIRTTVDVQGQRHRTVTLVPSQLRGEGESGTVYMVVGSQPQQGNILGFPQQTFMFTNVYNVVSVGGTDNFSAIFTVHGIVAADGTVTVDVVHGPEECHG